MAKSIRDIAFEVIFGKWGNGNQRKAKLKKSGYDYDKVQAVVNDILKKKATDTIAKEVIAGKWGSGETRKKRLTKVGYNYNTIQKRVNEILAKKTNAEKLADKAKEFAYAYGTKKSVYAYPSGKPKESYKKGLQTAYGDRKGWGKQTKAGASCDVFAGTCIRCSGYDKKFPRGLAEQIPYIAKSSKWKSINPKKLSDLKPGDVIIWKKTSGVGHICIYIGGSKVCEAGYKTKRYGCTTKKSADYFIPSKHKKGYKTFKVYRCSK